MKALYTSTLSKHFTQALYQGISKSILEIPIKHFIQALYTSTLSKHFTQALYPSTLHKHFIKALYKGITKVLQRYYDKIGNNSLSNIFVQLIYRGEVLRSITCLRFSIFVEGFEG